MVLLCNVKIRLVLKFGFYSVVKVEFCTIFSVNFLSMNGPHCTVSTARANYYCHYILYIYNIYIVVHGQQGSRSR